MPPAIGAAGIRLSRLRSPACSCHRGPVVCGSHLGPWFGYLYRFFIAENLDRFATARYNDPRPFWFYIPILIGGLLPWSMFGFSGCGGRVRVSAGRDVGSTPYSADRSWAVVPFADLLGFRGEATALHPSLPRAACDPPGIHDFQPRSSERDARPRDVPLTIAGVLAGAVLLAWECFSFAQRRW